MSHKNRGVFVMKTKREDGIRNEETLFASPRLPSHPPLKGLPVYHIRSATASLYTSVAAPAPRTAFRSFPPSFARVQSSRHRSALSVALLHSLTPPPPVNRRPPLRGAPTPPMKKKVIGSFRLAMIK
jgi:hypothetical protein